MMKGGWGTASAAVTVQECRRLGATPTIGRDESLSITGLTSLPSAVRQRIHAQRADIVQFLEWEARQQLAQVAPNLSHGRA
jgi:hypothetical protein